MDFPRRKLLHLAAGAAALPMASRIARAQSYPSRPVRLIVGFPPAGQADITARLLGQWLSERLGQQFVIESRPGAGSTLATEAVAKSPPDGYTLLLTGSTDAWNATLYGNLKFNYIRDIVPVASVSRGALDRRVAPEAAPDRLGERLRAVDAAARTSRCSWMREACGATFSCINRGPQLRTTSVPASCRAECDTRHAFTGPSSRRRTATHPLRIALAKA
jgi:hypothetical protein